MTLTYRNTRRVYQRSQRGAPAGVIDNVLARYTGTDGVFDITNESTRTRIYAASNPFTSDFLYRMVTLTNTPPSSSTAGTLRAENWATRIISVAGDGSWAELDSFRADVAGSGITYAVHAAARFTDVTADFPDDDSPAAIRTNSGPVTWQCLFFTSPTNEALKVEPFTITNRISATQVLISDTFNLLSTIPTESSLRWELRDRPAYTVEGVFWLIHWFLISAGWTLFQFRGRNVQKNIWQDCIYFSDQESGMGRTYLRMISAGNGAAASSLGSGIDFALWTAWDRNLDVSSVDTGKLNVGGGINPTHLASSTINSSNTNGWAGFADANNATTTSQMSCAFGGAAYRQPFFNIDNTLWSGAENVLHTPHGGQLIEAQYVMFGDKNSVEIYFSAAGIGHSHISFGFLTPRPETNTNNFILRSDVTNGASVTLRIGGPQKGDAAYPSDGEDPQNPAEGYAYSVGDSIQVVGQSVLGVPTVGNVTAWALPGERIESSTIVSFPGNLAAIGSITCIAAASIVEGSSVTIDDGSTIYIFEFDTDASITGGSVQVDLSGATTSDDVKNALISAINGTGIQITASDGGTGLVSLVHDVVGGVGNVTITTTVAAGGFAVSGMNGGGYSLQLAALTNSYKAGALVGEDPQPTYIASPGMTSNDSTDPTTFSGVAPGAVTISLSNRSRAGTATYLDGVAVGHSSATDNGLGYKALITKGAASSTAEVAPSARTARFGLLPLYARDYNGAQLRGSLPYVRLASPRLGVDKVVDDRNGMWHCLVPFHQPFSNAISSDITRYVMAFGPMPRAMAVVD